ncbi:MAG: hypothetical protein ACFFCI_02350 [Promethearchaeota archaeon]
MHLTPFIKLRSKLRVTARPQKYCARIVSMPIVTDAGNALWM